MLAPRYAAELHSSRFVEFWTVPAEEEIWMARIFTEKKVGVSP